MKTENRKVIALGMLLGLLSTFIVVRADLALAQNVAPRTGAVSSPLVPEKVAIDKVPDLDPGRLKGVDTIVVSVSMWPKSQEILVQGDTALLTVADEVQKVFADATAHLPINQIKVLPVTTDQRNLDVTFLQKPNVVRLTFVFSARQQSIAGKPVNVAALTWGIGKLGSRDTYEHTQGSAYPFVVSGDKEEKLQLIRDAVAHSLAALPNYFACADSFEKYGSGSPECPDCTLKVCDHLPALVQP